MCTLSLHLQRQSYPEISGQTPLHSIKYFESIYYSPNPLSIASIIAFNAFSSSSPSQISRISSPDLIPAPRILSTLLALAIEFSYSNDPALKFVCNIAENSSRTQMQSCWICDFYFLTYHSSAPYFSSNITFTDTVLSSTQPSGTPTVTGTV